MGRMAGRGTKGGHCRYPGDGVDQSASACGGHHCRRARGRDVEVPGDGLRAGRGTAQGKGPGRCAGGEVLREDGSVKQVVVMAHQEARRRAVEAVRLAPDGDVVRVSPPTRILEPNALVWSRLTDLPKL